MISLQNALRKRLQILFATPDGERSTREVILWWEERRIPYNLMVGIVGSVSFVLFLFFISQAESPDEPGGSFLPVLFAPILINICYTMGWIVELILRRRMPQHAATIGPTLLKLGLGFSLFVLLLPSGLWGLIWLTHLFRR